MKTFTENNCDLLRLPHEHERDFPPICYAKIRFLSHFYFVKVNGDKVL